MIKKALQRGLDGFLYHERNRGDSIHETIFSCYRRYTTFGYEVSCPDAGCIGAVLKQICVIL